MDNLRWGKRFPTDLKARFGVDSCSAVGIIEDLSVFGFFLRSSHPYPPSTLLRIEIHYERGRIIALEGKVQRVQERKKFLFWVKKEAGMGIKITRFFAGQDEYDNLCQQLCHLAA